MKRTGAGRSGNAARSGVGGEIESELELSRRMAAIGRLTSGVGHEVKNPINAIVVHLELLKSKLGERKDRQPGIWR
jgi:signal transduction histidine kinase